jgi:hypothetical protein
MTADEVLDLCRAATTKPLTRMQTRIGFPREQSIGGELMRKIAGLFPDCADEAALRKSGFVALSLAQMRQLEQELDRDLVLAGDVLFGMICVGLCDSDAEFAEMFNQDGDGIDGRHL